MNKHEILQNLIDKIRVNYNPEEKIKVTKEGKETIFFRKAGKALCYIEKREVPQVVITLGKTLNDKVLSSSIRDSVKEIFLNTKEFHDGRWLIFQLRTTNDIDDIMQLLSIKRKVDGSR